MWKVHVGTLFPSLFPGTLGVSCAAKGMRDGLWELSVQDLRDFATDKHRTVDDMVFGGSGGMLIQCDIVYRWVESLPKTCLNKSGDEVPLKKIFLSPRGRVFKQAMVEDLVAQDLSILCGRYEGVDARVIEHCGFEEISIGDFVLYGGEVAAMALLEACTRYFVVPEAYEDDSFGQKNMLLECNHYTRPAVWSPDGEVEYPVPDVLLSGNHAKIEEWKMQNALEITAKRRPDLLGP